MQAIISYLKEILTNRGHFNIYDELYPARITQITEETEDIYSTYKLVNSFRKKGNSLATEKVISDLNHKLTVFKDLEKFFSKYGREIFNSLVKDSRPLKSIFDNDLFLELKKTFPNIDINEKLNICYLNNGRIEFPKDFDNVLLSISKIKPNKTHRNFFRGHINSSFRLIPSIYRPKAHKFEKQLLYDTINLMPEEVKDASTTFEILTKLQHFGTPTRLLDITTNPLVALYFSCYNSDDANGEVLCFEVGNEDIKLFDSDTVSILANLSKMNADFNVLGLDTLTLAQFNRERE